MKVNIKRRNDIAIQIQELMFMLECACIKYMHRFLHELNITKTQVFILLNMFISEQEEAKKLDEYRR